MYFYFLLQFSAGFSKIYWTIGDENKFNHTKNYIELKEELDWATTFYYNWTVWRASWVQSSVEATKHLFHFKIYRRGC